MLRSMEANPVHVLVGPPYRLEVLSSDPETRDKQLRGIPTQFGVYVGPPPPGAPLELPKDIAPPPPPEPEPGELGGIELVWRGPLSRIPSDSRGRWSFVQHCRWRLAHIREAQAEVRRRYPGAELSRRVERLNLLEKLWRARMRLAELGEPRLKFARRFDAARYEAECERLLTVVRTCEQIDPPPAAGETGQDFLDKLAEIVGG